MPFSSGYTFTNIITGSGITNFTSDIQTISRAYIATTSQLASTNISDFTTAAQTAGRTGARNTAGDVLKIVVLNNAGTAVTSVSPTVASPQQILSYVYTPAEAGTTLFIEFNCTYEIGGTLADLYRAELRVDGARISNKYQKWNNAAGGGTRSGTILPIAGKYTNSTTASKTITVVVYQDGSDDTFTCYDDDANLLKITEIQA